MAQLSSEGQQVVNNLSARSGFSPDAVTHMLFAVINGNGSMAQFSHPEFGGSGQWMRGGMTMIGDMFNNGLKSRVDSLCFEISGLLANQPGLIQTGSFQSQNQGSQSQGSGSGFHGNSTLFVPEKPWYPAEFGQPNATGAQNNMRYAYFANAHRLAVDTGGSVWVYDTLNHQIGGFSQQQGGSNSIAFNSQFGTVNLSNLPVVYRDGHAVSPSAPAPAPPPSYSPTSNGSNGSNGNSSDIFSAIERLGSLKAQGILSEDEFATKKAELLSRL